MGDEDQLPQEALDAQPEGDPIPVPTAEIEGGEETPEQTWDGS